MTLYLTREQVRNVDAKAIHDFNIPGIVLMENAGANATRVILQLLASRNLSKSDSTIAIVCGRGNNGGDGFVIGRHLHNAGWTVRLIYLAEPDQLPSTDDSRINKQICERLGLSITACPKAESLSALLASANCIIDAYLGTGLSRPLHKTGMGIVAAINASRKQKTVISIDVPSGFDCDRGTALGDCVHADYTITMAAKKVGFKNVDSTNFTGEVRLVGIGIPERLVAGVLE